jgi:hypothetical protein
VKTLIACLRTPVGNLAVGLIFGLILAVVMRLAIQRVF